MNAFFGALTLVPSFVAIGSLVFGLVWWSVYGFGSENQNTTENQEKKCSE